MPHNAGLGELLRYVTDLVDQGAERLYQEMAMNYRPRFTPVLRAIVAGATTVTEITASTFLTQGAISQSVAMMEKEGILIRQIQEDGRKNTLLLTERGKELVAVLSVHWDSIFLAIGQLEQEIGHSLRTVLSDTARALEAKSFDERIKHVRAGGDRNDDNEF